MTADGFRCDPLAPGGAPGEALERLGACAESFFQTPLWTRTWLEHLPPGSRPWCCRLGEPDAPEAMALIGRRRLRLGGRLPLPLRRASLSESGEPGFDRLAVEFNGPLLRRPSALPAFLEGLLRATAGDYELLVARCTPQLTEALQAAAGRQGRGVTVYRRSLGWLCELPAAPEPQYLERLGRSTRQAVRRTRRRLEQEGEVRLTPARSDDEALAFFAGLRDLHERTWQARGEAGAFASPRLVAFHESLIARGHPGAVQLLRLSAGRRTLGYLYNFRHGPRVYQYQGGFDYVADPRLNLGLLAHVLAIEHHRAEGVRCYDLLAGDARYKRQLATRSYRLDSCRIAGRIGRWLQPA